GVCPRDFLWLEAEYLVWWIKKGPVAAPLVTLGSFADAVPGGLGQPNTFIAFGDQGINYDAFSGGRWTAGFWVTADHLLGFECSGFLLETRPIRFNVQSDSVGLPLIAQPFFNPLSGTEDAQPIAVPGLLTGGVNVTSESRLWGAEGSVKSCIFRNCTFG